MYQLGTEPFSYPPTNITWNCWPAHGRAQPPAITCTGDTMLAQQLYALFVYAVENLRISYWCLPDSWNWQIYVTLPASMTRHKGCVAYLRVFALICCLRGDDPLSLPGMWMVDGGNPPSAANTKPTAVTSCYNDCHLSDPEHKSSNTPAPVYTRAPTHPYGKKNCRFLTIFLRHPWNGSIIFCWYWPEINISDPVLALIWGYLTV